jgi:hypothetical protein
MSVAYKCWNGPAPTTAAQVKVTTGTAIKTMLQLATPATAQITVLSWGFSLDAASAAIGVVELLETDVAATVTAHIAAGVQPQIPGAPASLLTLGTAATGYTATAEGSTTASRVFDVKEVPIAAGLTDLTYVYQFMPDERPVIAVSKFLRVRATFTSATNMLCWVTFQH